MMTSGPVRLVRFFFALPEVMDLPDGVAFTEAVGPSSDVHGDPLEDPSVSVVYHQVALEMPRRSVPVVAVALELYSHLAASSSPNLSNRIEDEEGTVYNRYTIVEALTSYKAETDGSGAMYLALDGCLRLVRDHVRAYRLSAKQGLELPNIFGISRDLAAFSANGEMVVTEQGIRTSSSSDWVLEDVSSLLAFTQHATEGARADPDTFAYWMRELRSGNPLIVWRDRAFAAQRAHLIGDHVTTVLHVATAAEVLLDRLLLMLLWESKVLPVDAAALFTEGQVMKRIQQELAPRLRGNWQTAQRGPVQDWYQNVSRLRNRVVHGGYVPSSTEAATALNAIRGLEQFAFDRLAARRQEYPRSALLTVAPEGLKRRGLWNGQVRRFVESGEAKREPNWQGSFRSWRDKVDRSLS